MTQLPKSKESILPYLNGGQTPEPELPPLYEPCEHCHGTGDSCAECEGKGIRPTKAGWQVLTLLHKLGLTW